MAGIADAVANNGIGVAGVARSAKIMAVRVLDDMGMGDLSWVAEGIVYAADNGAKVINLSLGVNFDAGSIALAVQHARDKGAVIVAAAGNAGSSGKYYPAAYEGVIAVTATDQNDRSASFSSYGEWVSVSAPGVSIYSTMPTYPVFATDWNGFKQNYDYASGTSMAAPVVAGEAALILSHYPDLTADQVAEAIRNTADDLGVPGFDPYYGWGRVNAATALKMDTVGPLELAKWRVDDVARSGIQGNGDGVINPGESVALYLTLKNRGGQNAGAVSVAVTTADAYVTIDGAGMTALASIPRWGADES